MAITLENPSATTLVVITLLLAVSWKVLKWVWLRLKKLEKLLRQQGIGCNPYKFFHGDMKEITRMRSEANSVPMDDFSHDLFPRIRPFLNQTIKSYGKTCVVLNLRYLPTENNEKMKATNREINSLLSGIIDQRTKGKEAREDLLGILMNSTSQNEGCSKKQNFRISTQEMIDECKLFYFAGQETTSTLLTWTMILLGKHRELQSRAREEVLKTFGKNLQPDFEGLNHMKIMNMIFHEVLRLYPPFIQIRRTVVDDNTKLGSLVLPKGVILDLPILYIHHDTQVWGDDAKEFNPERFSQGISNASRGSMSFGWGPRVCIGSNFAMVEAKVVLSMILQHFAFQLSPSYVHAPSAYGILHPQFGAPIIFRRL